MCQDKGQNLYCRAKPRKSIVPLRHSVLTCYRPYLMTETFIIARGGGGGRETLSRGRNAVSAYFTSKHILHAGFAEQSTAFFFTQ